MPYSKSFVVMGNPFALARPRMAAGRLFDSQKYFKLKYGLVLNHQLADDRKFKGPLELEVTFFMDVMLAAAKRRATLLDQPHRTIPDLSNLIKYLEDSSEDVLFDNDCLIYKIVSQKIWSMNPRTEFTLRETE